MSKRLGQIVFAVCLCSLLPTLAFAIAAPVDALENGIGAVDEPPTEDQNSAKKQKRSRYGIGLGFGWLNDYPGAGQGRLQFLPFPIYRGDRFRLDRLDGMSGRVANSKNWNFSWSFVFQFPVESVDIPVRRGMSDLDWLLSIGPMVKWNLWQAKGRKLFLRFPFRGNICTDFFRNTRYCGISLNPGIRYSHDVEDYGNFTFRYELFADSKSYNDYYYTVRPGETAANRPEYQAQTGFLGSVLGLIHTMPLQGWDIVTALSYYDYGLSANRSSPLFITPTNYSIFIAITLDL